MDKYIDLHLHLDGSLSHASAKKLCIMQGMDVPGDLDSLLSLPKDCKDLNDYLKCFDFPLTLLQTKDALSESITTLCTELEQIGVEYAEIRFAPQLHTKRGLTQKEVIDAACKGLKSSSLNSSLILCCMRGKENAAANEETLKLCCDFMGKGVVALDLAGAEALYPTRDFKHLFEMAAKENIPYTIHAGEAEGSVSVADAITMGALRIGHGVRSSEDESVVDMLVKYSIPLEICPTSNLDTRVFESISDMPVKYFIDKGVCVTVNSDNMSVSNTDVKRETELVCDTFGIEKSLLLFNARKASFVK